jgi:hypothetical protein
VLIVSRGIQSETREVQNRRSKHFFFGELLNKSSKELLTKRDSSKQTQQKNCVCIIRFVVS